MVAISLILKDGGTGPNGSCCLNKLDTQDYIILPVIWTLTDTSCDSIADIRSRNT
jgi:hypothetical protein